ncbi:hypothetical protein WAI453_007622 [Rhynchosporium graminicola]
MQLADFLDCSSSEVPAEYLMFQVGIHLGCIACRRSSPIGLCNWRIYWHILLFSISYPSVIHMRNMFLGQ